jgi:AcrR family transcriptional regulator
MTGGTARPQAPSPQQVKSDHTRRTLLGAAREVVRTDGVSRLTLEAVARAAGVSKGGLLYHFATKQDLIVAMLTDTLVEADAILDSLAAADSRQPGAFARAYLEFVSRGEHRRVDSASGIFAAAALDEGDLTPARAMFRRWQDRLLDDGIDTGMALLARVVADGLWLIDLFDLAPPDSSQREELLSLVDQLLTEGQHP